MKHALLAVLIVAVACEASPAPVATQVTDASTETDGPATDGPDAAADGLDVAADGTDAAAPDSDVMTSGGTAAACLAHTPDENACKDCCDCLDLPCAEVVACRDACPLHDFAGNDGSLVVTPAIELGPGGDYSVCTQAATEQACKVCCECEDRYLCGDKKSCRDACNAVGGSAFPALKIEQLGAPVLVKADLQFAEGPVWDAKAGALYFSDIAADTIYRFDPGAGTGSETFSVFVQPSHQANGLALDASGALLAAEHGSRSVTRRAADGATVTLASQFEGKNLNSPNDLDVGGDGTIYFSDPTYGLGNQPSDLGFTGVYRLAPGGALSLEAKVEGQPNGVTLAPGGKVLYVAATTANQVLAFDVAGNGALSSSRTFQKVDAPDGMAVDQAGNLFVAALDQGHGAVVVLDPTGKRLGAIPLGHQPTNCGFGGTDRKTLHVTARTALYRIAVPIPGK
ncbi:MAG: SMP-30/gluconolactonase/LRE family protein [Myxococcota bacterium]